MLRFRFDVDDLGRTRFASTPSPVITTMLSAQMLCRPPTPLFLPWYRRAHRNVSPSARPLFDLVRAGTRIPGFLMPATDGDEMASFREQILTTPASLLRADLDRVYPRSEGAPSWVRLLATGDTDARETLLKSVRSYYDDCLAEQWTSIREHLLTDLADQAQAMSTRGLHHVLDTLHPVLRWNSPVLERRTTCRDTDIDLASRGMVLCPCLFAWPHPRALKGKTPILIYPPRAPFLRWTDDAHGDGDPLAELLGRTRAAILRTLVHRPSTSTIARQLDTSLPTASLHVKALRNAGLASTRRTGKAVQHSLTDLGCRLLDRTGR